MIESLIRSNPPDYDELERRSVDYILALRKVTRPFTFLLFLMPIALIFIWLFFIESPVALALSVSAYVLLAFFAVYSRYRAEKKYRELTVNFGYYLIHSDFSVYTIRVASLVLAVLIFVLIETYHGFNQQEFFYVILAFIAASFLLNVFSPRFLRYERMATEIQSPSIQSEIERIAASGMIRNFSIKVVPEKKMKVANAYCTGFIRNRIYVTDYLLENLTEDESIVILAHEMGHVYFRHNLKTLALTFLLLFASAVLFFSYLYITDPLYSVLLTQGGVLLFIIGIPIIVPSVKRGYELQADMFASGFKSEEISVNALLKTNYLNLTPMVASGGVTHPPLPTRIDRIRRAIRVRDLRAKI